MTNFKNSPFPEKGKQPRMRFSGEGPDKPHLIVEHRPGEHLAMPPGAKMGIVVDKTKYSTFHHLALWSVTNDKLVFKCLCNPTCEVLHEYKRLPTKGAHAR